MGRMGFLCSIIFKIVSCCSAAAYEFTTAEIVAAI